MANNDNPRGLSVARDQGASGYTGAVNRYFIPASDGTATFIGGVVKAAGGGDADGVPTVTGNVSVGDVLVGVVAGVEAVTHDSVTHREASTDRYVLVIDDPRCLFEIQEDSVGSTLAAADIWLNASLTGITGGAAINGRSSMELDSSTKNTTATLDLSIHRLVRRSDNEIGTNAKWLVRLNNHQFVDGTTGV